MSADLSRFVSLGANCEFGFFLRQNQVKTSTLLLWTVTPPGALLKGLRDGFAGLYEFENLVPFQKGMVADRASGLKFHSKLVSARAESGSLEFVDDEDTRREIHKDEKEKFLYMRDKLLGDLASGGFVFLYKHGAKSLDPTLSLMDEIAAEVRRFNAGNTLLFVFKARTEAPGSVVSPRPGLLHGYLDRFAPSDHAADTSRDCWLAICERAAEMAGLPPAPPAAAGPANPPWYKRLLSSGAARKTPNAPGLRGRKTVA